MGKKLYLVGEILRDLAIQAKVLLSAVTIILLLDDAHVITDKSWNMKFHICQSTPGGVTEHKGDVPFHVARHACGAYTMIDNVRSTLIALVVVNQLLFVVAVLLKYKRPLRRHSWSISVVVASAAMCFALIKLLLVTSALMLSVRYECAHEIDVPGVSTVGYCLSTHRAFNVTAELGLACVSCDVPDTSCAPRVRCDFDVTVGLEVFFLSASFLLSAFYILQCLYEYMDDDVAIMGQVGATRHEHLMLAEMAKTKLKSTALAGEGVEDVVLLKKAAVLRKRKRQMANKRVYYSIVQDISTGSKLFVVVASIAILLFKPHTVCEPVSDGKGTEASGNTVKDDCSPQVTEQSWILVYVFCWLGVSSVVVFAVVSIFDKMLWFHRQARLVAIGFVCAILALLVAQATSLAAFFNQPVWFDCTVTNDSGNFSEATSLCREKHTAVSNIPVECGNACYSAASTEVYTLGASVFLSVVYQLFLVWRYYRKCSALNDGAGGVWLNKRGL